MKARLQSSALQFLQSAQHTMPCLLGQHIVQRRQRHYWKNMESELLQPPAMVRGMQRLDREVFHKVIKVPKLRVVESQANKVLPVLKKYLLKMEQLRPVCTLVSNSEDCTMPMIKEILLHPLPVRCWESLPTAELEQLQVKPTDFYYADLELNYNNWRADEIFKCVLPAEQEGLTSYSRIGHIVHLNLRDHLLPYKQLIGEVLKDKVVGCRTVVNKAATIDNTYRNFQLELICGTPDCQVQTKENGIMFELDFSKVYWNPRLSTEHERIVQLLQPGDVLYDVFAGVIPFSVLCTVLANDLNPESYKWLQHNAKRNKCLTHMRLFNKDRAEFISTDVRSDLLQRGQQQPNATPPVGNMHITMNLPALGVEFLPAFRGLCLEEPSLCFPSKMPLVHVYSFAKGENTKQLVQELVEKQLGMALGDCLQGVHFVRNVAPNKDMYRVSFALSKEMLTTKNTDVEESESAAKECDERKRTMRSFVLNINAADVNFFPYVFRFELK